MTQERQAELSLEMGVNDLRIHLAGFTLKVCLAGTNGGGPSEARSMTLLFPTEGPRSSKAEAMPAETELLAQEAAFYRQASEEIFAGLGKLAKEINLSLKDLSLETLFPGGGVSPGERLNQAQVQLTDVLAMTEQAAMSILDLVEQIAAECRVLESLLESPVQEAAAEADQTPAELASVVAAAQEFGHHLFSQTPFLSLERQTGLRFSLADALQMLLEFCGTEAVKPHLKSLLAQRDALFPVELVEQELSQMAAQSPSQDGFFQVPLLPLLELLRHHCQDERGRELWGKIIASAGKIFPVSALPLEGRPDAASPPAPAEELKVRWDSFLASLQEALANFARQGAGGSDPEEAAPERTQGLAATARIQHHLARITEALSFQDLSGQRLLKVLKILRQVQVQVLTLLVATGNKLKMKVAGQEISLAECELQAQAELIRLMGSHSPSESAGPPETPPASDSEPLDQQAINDLLAGLGF